MHSFDSNHASTDGSFCAGGVLPGVIIGENAAASTKEPSPSEPPAAVVPSEPLTVVEPAKKRRPDLLIAQMLQDDTPRVRKQLRASLADVRHSDDERMDDEFADDFFGEEKKTERKKKSVRRPKKASESTAVVGAADVTVPMVSAADPTLPAVSDSTKDDGSTSVEGKTPRDSKRYGIRAFLAVRDGFVLVEWDVEDGERKTWLPCIYILNCSTAGDKAAVAQELLKLAGKPVPSEYDGLPMKPTFSDRYKIELSHLILDGKAADGEWDMRLLYRVLVRPMRHGRQHEYVRGLISVKTLAALQGMDMGPVDEFVQAKLAQIRRAGRDRAALSRVMGLGLAHDDVTLPQLDAQSVLDRYMAVAEEEELREAAGILLESFYRHGVNVSVMP